MGAQRYDITHYQPVLFAGIGLEEVLDVVGTFFEECDDDSPARYALPAGYASTHAS
jgi:phenylalanine-4-hydroxylase